MCLVYTLLFFLQVRQASQEGLRVCGLIQHPSTLPVSAPSTHKLTPDPRQSRRGPGEHETQAQPAANGSLQPHSNPAYDSHPPPVSNLAADNAAHTQALCDESSGTSTKDTRRPRPSHQSSQVEVNLQRRPINAKSNNTPTDPPRTRSVARKEGGVAAKQAGHRKRGQKEKTDIDSLDSVAVVVSSSDEREEVATRVEDTASFSPHSSDSSLIMLSSYQPPSHSELEHRDSTLGFTESDEELFAHFVNEPPDRDEFSGQETP